MMRRLIVLLFVSTVVVSVNVVAISEQKPKKKMEVTFSSVMNAMHKNAYLVTGIYNAILLGAALSNDLYNYNENYNQVTRHGIIDVQDPRVKAAISLIAGDFIVMCCVHIVYASFWTLIEGAFIKHITKECDVNQE